MYIDPYREVNTRDAIADFKKLITVLKNSPSEEIGFFDVRGGIAMAAKALLVVVGFFAANLLEMRDLFSAPICIAFARFVGIWKGQLETTLHAFRKVANFKYAFRRRKGREWGTLKMHFS